MPRLKYRLTPQVQQKILSSIRAGADPRAAAEAWDIPAAMFEAWLERGQRPKSRPPYSEFATAVRAARAQARIKAEMEIFNGAARVWLEHGPGKTETAPDGGNALLNRTLMELFRSLLEVLQPFPEARARAAEVLAGGQSSVAK
jgi:hypothetical protein